MKILNPKTNRYVDANGKIGKKILAEQKILLKNLPKIPNLSFKNKDILTDNTKNLAGIKNDNEKQNTNSNIFYNTINTTTDKIELNNKNNMTKKVTFEIIKKTSNKKENIVLDQKITIDDFQKLLDNTNFIDAYRKSVIALLKYKIKMYEEYIKKSLLGESNSINTYQSILKNIKTHLNLIEGFRGYSIIETNLKLCFSDTTNGILSLKNRIDIMNKLVGLLYIFSKNYEIFINSMNFSLCGNFNVGKSSLAKVIAFILKQSFLLSYGTLTFSKKNFFLLPKEEFQSLIKTRLVLLNSLEGVLYIDQPYEITGCSDEIKNEYIEIIMDEIMYFMDKFKGSIVIIIAGDCNKIENCFYRFNHHLDRFFPHKFKLDNFTPEQFTNLIITKLEYYKFNVNFLTQKYILYFVSLISNNNPDAFNSQAYDAIKISNLIIQNIYLNKNTKWNVTYPNNQNIIVESFNEFLSDKGYNMIMSEIIS